MKGKWVISRIGDRKMMARSNGNAIETRNLNWIEKVLYFWYPDALYPSIKNDSL